MSSPLSLLFDTYYHIYNRGNNRENIFLEERNYYHFINLSIKHIEPVAEILAYCLLRNHFHWLVRIKSEKEILEYQAAEIVALNKKSVTPKPLKSNYPSQQFSNFFNAYAKAINNAYNRTGSLFQHPFGRVPVTTDRQFWNVIAYIHQNPQKHKFVKDFRDWKWSSYGVLLSEKAPKRNRDLVTEWFGGRQEYLDLHTRWVSDADAKWFAQDDND